MCNLEEAATAFDSATLSYNENKEPSAFVVNHKAALDKHPSCAHLSGALGSLLQAPAVGGPAISGVAVVGDEEVVKEDVGGHGPELQPQSAERRHPERVLVLEELGVGDLPRLPDALRTEAGSSQDPSREN